jgi:ribosomal protein L37AE/L43A
MRARKIAYCPGCGKPLAKKATKGKYYCENESCKVIFVKYPYNPDIAEIFFKPSTSKKTIEKIEKTPIQIQCL